MASVHVPQNVQELYSDYELLRKLDEEVQELMINIKTGEYVFMTPVAKNIVIICANRIFIACVRWGAIVGGAFLLKEAVTRFSFKSLSDKILNIFRNTISPDKILDGMIRNNLVIDSATMFQKIPISPQHMHQFITRLPTKISRIPAEFTLKAISSNSEASSSIFSSLGLNPLNWSDSKILVTFGLGASVSEVLIKGMADFSKLEKDLDNASENIASLLQHLFQNTMQSKARDEIENELPPQVIYENLRLICPLSLRLMHIPVSTGCEGGVPHIFDLGSLINHLKTKDTCPSLDCSRKIDPKNIKLEYKVRKRIQYIVQETFKKCARFQSAQVDLREVNSVLLRDPEDFKRRIDENELTEEEYGFLADLIRKEVDEHTNRLEKFTIPMMNRVNNDSKLSFDEKYDFQTFIRKIMDSFRIRLPQFHVDPDDSKERGVE